MKNFTICFFLILQFNVNYYSQSISSTNGKLDQEYVNFIIESMEANDIPGLSIAIVKSDSILFMDAFGFRDRGSKSEVNENTIFSLQSISKLITSTAIMFAVQEGLISLDVPISEYLPGFHVNSVYEDEPGKKITIRHLLSHRAGFTHEAPHGNNYQTEFDSFEKHIQSISNTWLKAPVEEIYSYSNLGFDLAGYILQKRSNVPFEDFIRSRVFEPLEMFNTTFDWDTIIANDNRAAGSCNNSPDIPIKFAMIPSGACYSSISDMCKFLQFHLNRGKYKNKVLLEEKYLDEMYDIPFSNEKVGYALGIDVHNEQGAISYQHGGGGFGFSTFIKWMPEYKIGYVILTNSSCHNNKHVEIADLLLDSLSEVNKNGSVFEETNELYDPSIELSEEAYSKYEGYYILDGENQLIKVLKQNNTFGAQGEGYLIPFNFTSNNGDFFITGFGNEFDGRYKICFDKTRDQPKYIINSIGKPILIFNGRLNEEFGPNKEEWKKIAGKYIIKRYGRNYAVHEISIRNGYLFFDELRLNEFSPNLFYNGTGEIIDFRNTIPTYRNIELTKLE